MSPLLSKIYLDKFDQWVDQTLIPAHTRGQQRRENPAYGRINRRLYKMRKRGKSEGVKALIHQRRALPSKDPQDPAYSRLRYVRYADDFLLGFAGTHAEATEIKRHINDWLRDNLRLDLSDEKTLITHATTQAARFLGYDIKTSHADDKVDVHKRRTVNGKVSLRVPASVVERKCARDIQGRVIMHRAALLCESDYSIISQYQQEYRGIVQYYCLAHNVAWVDKLRWVLRGSLLKTLAAKQRTSVGAMVRKYTATTQTPNGKTYTCLEVRVERQDKPPLIARFGGIPLVRQPDAILNDRPVVVRGGRTELLQQLLADTCTLCGSRENVEVHHVRKLADLAQMGTEGKAAVGRTYGIASAQDAGCMPTVSCSYPCGTPDTAHGTEGITREPRAGKPCAVSRTTTIATTSGRSLGYVLRGERANLIPKGRREQEHAVKRSANEDMYRVAPQHLRDTVKATLLEL